jgi:RNA polymerase sigma factor (sigma-70 family)
MSTTLEKPSDAALWRRFRSAKSTRRREAARAAIVEHYTPKVRDVARAMNAGRLFWREFDDLLQDGYLGLLHAVDHFVDSRGVLFWTYADPCVRGHMLHACRRERVKRAVFGPTRSLDGMREVGRYGEDWKKRYEHPGADGRDSEVRSIAKLDLEAAIERIPERWRLVARMRYEEGRTVDEIGESIGRTRQRAAQIIQQIETRIFHLLPIYGPIHRGGHWKKGARLDGAAGVDQERLDREARADE